MAIKGKNRTIKKVLKRTGKIEKFDSKKIKDVIIKAGKVTGEFDEKKAKELTVKVLYLAQQTLTEGIPTYEDVANIVEEVLMNTYKATAKVFILYRDQQERLSEFTVSEQIKLVNQYLKKKDWKVSENSNMGYSLQGLQNYISSEVSATYWLSAIYPKDIRNAHKNGDLHIHDLSNLASYCFTGDTKVSLVDGTNPTFKELVNNYSDKKFWVYSIDSNNNIVPGLARNPRITRRNVQLIEITLDNDKSIKCTPDHKFMLRTGKYKEAKDLLVTDSLMPLYINNEGIDYRTVYNPQTNDRQYVHRLFWGAKKARIATNKSDEQKAYGSYGNSKRKYGIDKVEYLTFVKKAGDIPLKEYSKKNHKIKSIQILNTKEDVYDLTVDKYHNFALEAGVFVHNCVGWDLEDLLKEGFRGVETKTESKPPKHFRTALGQIVNFFYTLQGESAGAQAFSSFDTLLAPFVYYDKLEYTQVKQAIQEFIFNVNVPTRVGFQAPFTNITLDLNVSPNYINTPVIIAGKEKKKVYGDFQKEMNMINKAFCEIMAEGDAKGRIFTFPIPTVNITKDFDWDNKDLDILWQITGKYGVPYFSNFINSSMKPEDSRSMCCRLRLDNRELKKRGGGLFGSNPLTGSIGVVTINMPRLAYNSTNKKEFYENLKHLMIIAKESLKIKRDVLEKFTDEELYPYSKFYLRNVKQRFNKYWKNHFSTIGLLGMNEACLNLLGVDISSKEGKEFAEDALVFMRNILVEFQEETGDNFNLEATPAEGACYSLALKDKDLNKNIICANEEAYRQGAEPYYSNSTQLPVKYTDNIIDALDLQDKLQSSYTGGTVLHLFLGEKIDDFSTVKKLVKAVCENYRLPYFSITPTFSICPIHGYLSGEHHYCPKCDADIMKQTKGE